MFCYITTVTRQCPDHPVGPAVPFGLYPSARADEPPSTTSVAAATTSGAAAYRALSIEAFLLSDFPSHFD